MLKFKTGDRVKRVTENFLNAKVGQVYTVDRLVGSYSLTLKEIQGTYDAELFVLVGKEPKPWLKVTPPQPEKRELVACRLLNGLFITPHDPAIRMAVTTQGVSVHYDKDQLRELGETLIEISKEMRSDTV